MSIIKQIVGFTCRVVAVAAVGTIIPSASAVWINEFHYDNAGGDVGEFVEIAGEAGTDLTGWSLVLYNGSGGALYDTVSLSGSLPDLSNGFGVLSVATPDMQNGPRDGIALVNADSSEIQFLSYEGVLTAVGGPANGKTSVDIGRSESSSTPVGFSLQLTGTGNTYDDFTWSVALAETPDAVNTGQTFEPVVLLNGATSSVPDGGGTAAMLLAGLGLTAVRRRRAGSN